MTAQNYVVIVSCLWSNSRTFSFELNNLISIRFFWNIGNIERRSFFWVKSKVELLSECNLIFRNALEIEGVSYLTMSFKQFTLMSQVISLVGFEVCGRSNSICVICFLRSFKFHVTLKGGHDFLWYPALCLKTLKVVTRIFESPFPLSHKMCMVSMAKPNIVAISLTPSTIT